MKYDGVCFRVLHRFGRHGVVAEEGEAAEGEEGEAAEGAEGEGEEPSGDAAAGE